VRSSFASTGCSSELEDEAEDVLLRAAVLSDRASTLELPELLLVERASGRGRGRETEIIGREEGCADDDDGRVESAAGVILTDGTSPFILGLEADDEEEEGDEDDEEAAEETRWRSDVLAADVRGTKDPQAAASLVFCTVT